MQIEGPLVERPEGNFTPNGKFVCTLRIMVDSVVKKATLWDEAGEKVFHNLEVGDKVRLFGSLKTRWWTKTDGEKMSEEYFSAYRLQLLEKGKSGKISESCCLGCLDYPDKCEKGICYDSLADSSVRLCVIDKICPFEEEHKECFRS